MNKPDPVSFDKFCIDVDRLVKQFERNLTHYKSGTYDEASLRQEFLNPFFRALGWDVENKAGHIPQHREVEIESRTEIAGRQKRADYLFRTDRQDRFICEAKKPAEILHVRYAFQASRYAWNKGLYLALLTDFEELKVYVVGSKPHPEDSEKGLWKSWHYKQYSFAAKEIWDIIARDNVASGSIEKLIDTLPRKPVAKGKARQQWLFKPDRTRALDVEFLNFLDESRRDLASDMLRHNDRDDLLEGSRLNEAVQRVLDRLLFLRICEDRDIDTGRPLAFILKAWRDQTETPGPGRPRQADLINKEKSAGKPVKNHPSLWRDVVAHFRALDRRPPSHIPFFNGNLFKPHFSEELVVSDEWMADFLDDVSDDESPYLFNVIPIEILGTIYERFLGKVVYPKGRGVAIDDKPDVRKAGGVFYTPRYIVDYVVEKTIGNLLEGISPSESMRLRVIDPACGSGSFLIRAYERICEHWQEALTKNEKLRLRKDCWSDPETGDIHLTVDLKRRILTANIYGVDIDAGAVEVTQLSLYLKMLEGENRTTLARNRDLFGSNIALLPPLEGNVKCFNSLVSSDFSMLPDDLVASNAQDWDVQYSGIMGNGGFDVIIGNPPWGATLAPLVRKYLSAKYERVVERMVDSYIYFTDQALRLCKKKGSIGFVIPSTVLNQVDAKPLRSLLLDTGLVAVINMGKDIFTKKVLNTTTLLVTAGGKQPPKVLVGDFSDIPLEQRSTSLLELKPIDSSEWIKQVRSDGANTFFVNSDSCVALLIRLRTKHKTLSDYTGEGIARGISPDIAKAHVLADRDPELKRIEKEVLKRSISGPKIKRYGEVAPDQWLIYTHKNLHPKDIPNAIAHLGQFKSENTCKEVIEKKHPWWALHRARDPIIFNSPKLIGLTTTKTIEIIYDESKNLVVTDAMYVFRLKPGVNVKAALAVLHSRLFLYLYRISNQGESRVIPQIKAAKLEPLPFPDLTDSGNTKVRDRLAALADRMLALMPKMQATQSDTEKATLKNAVTATDKQINELVYEIYGLTKEEIDEVNNLNI